MRAFAALALAAAACASAGAPATKVEGPAARKPDPAPGTPLDASPEALAARIVKAQKASRPPAVTTSFTPVEVDLMSGDDTRVAAAARVIEEICVRVTRERGPNDRFADLLVTVDPLTPLVDHIDDLLGKLRAKGNPAAVRITARARKLLERVPRFERVGAGDPSAHPLSNRALVLGMNAIRDKVTDCYTRYRIAGTAMVDVVIGKQGTVTAATPMGPFAETPTGRCVSAAVKTATFPPSDGMTTPYPFVLK